VDVKNVCMFELGVMHCIHGDDVNELLYLPANEGKKDAVFFLVSPLMEWFAVIIYYLGIFV